MSCALKLEGISSYNSDMKFKTNGEDLTVDFECFKNEIDDLPKEAKIKIECAQSEDSGKHEPLTEQKVNITEASDIKKETDPLEVNHLPAVLEKILEQILDTNQHPQDTCLLYTSPSPRD